MEEALREYFLHAKIDYLTFSNYKEACTLIGIKNILIINRDTLLHFVLTVFRTIFFLLTKKYDIVINAEFLSAFPVIITYLSGACYRVGFSCMEHWRRLLLTHNVKYNPSHHITDIFMSLAQAVGAEDKFSDRKIEIDLPQGTFLRKNSPFVVINVNAGEITPHFRRWPKEYFAEVAARIIEDIGIKVIFIGTREEKRYVNSVIELIHSQVYSKAINLAGKTNLIELIILLKGASLVITNDSGPLHLAAVVSTPTISFFGPETPNIFGPIGKNNVIFYKNLSCSPCLNVYNKKSNNCRYNFQCLRSISVEEVYREVKRILSHLEI
jgi:lipopolysaccharide heptosyltransferase II